MQFYENGYKQIISHRLERRPGYKGSRWSAPAPAASEK
jgi:hypothetical protein